MTTALNDATRAELLDTIKERSSDVDAAKENLERLQKDLNDVVFDGKEKGLKYREIATASNRSVAWVQAVLGKSGYRTRNQLASDRAASV